MRLRWGVGRGGTSHGAVCGLLLCGPQQGGQEQGVLGEHHVDHGELCQLRARGAFREVQELHGGSEGFQKRTVLIPKPGRQEPKGKRRHNLQETFCARHSIKEIIPRASTLRVLERTVSHRHPDYPSH